MTIVQGREILTGMNDASRRELEQAAAVYESGLPALRRAVLGAAAQGATPAEIHRTISRVMAKPWTYDYVAKIIREARGKPPASP